MNPGWYPDERGQPLVHYWDGTRWTGQVQPLQTTMHVRSRGGAANTLAALILGVLALFAAVVLGVVLYFVIR